MSINIGKLKIEKLIRDLTKVERDLINWKEIHYVNI
jgi:hypothetical protein